MLFFRFSGTPSMMPFPRSRSDWSLLCGWTVVVFALAFGVGCDREQASEDGEGSTASSPTMVKKGPKPVKKVKRSEKEESTGNEAEDEGLGDEREPPELEELPAEQVGGQLSDDGPLEGEEREVQTTRVLYDDRPFKFGDPSADPNSDELVLKTWSGAPEGKTDAVVAVHAESGASTGPVEAPRAPKGGLNWRRKGDWLLVGRFDSLENAKLVSLEDGKTHEAQVEAPEGVQLEDLKHVDTDLVRFGGSGSMEAWLFASQGDRMFAGSWSSADPSVELQEIREDGGTLNMLGEVDGRYYLEQVGARPAPEAQGESSTGCLYMRWEPGEEAACLLEGRFRPSGVTYLGDGWAVPGLGTPRVVAPDGDTITFEPEVCEDPTLLAPRTGDPGVLVGCLEDYSRKQQRYLYWTPERYVTFTAPASGTIEPGNVRSTNRVEGEADEPVVTGWWGGDADRFDYWFDMEHLRFWTSELLFPVHFAHQNDPMRALAADQKRGDAIAMERLDFEEGTRRKVTTYRDCPGVLRERLRAGDYAVVNCVVKSHPKKFRFRIEWSELIDLESGDRARLDGYPHHLRQNGEVVVSDRTLRRPGTFRRGTELRVVRMEDGS